MLICNLDLLPTARETQPQHSFRAQVSAPVSRRLQEVPNQQIGGVDRDAFDPLPRTASRKYGDDFEMLNRD